MIYFFMFFIPLILFFLINPLIKIINIINFNKRVKNHYYKEIPGYFKEFFWNKTNSGQEILFGKTYSTPIFTYKIDNDEYILRGLKVSPSTYRSGQKVTLYQDPKSGKIFENPNNAKHEIISFLFLSISLIAFVIFLSFVMI